MCVYGAIHTHIHTQSQCKVCYYYYSKNGFKNHPHFNHGSFLPEFILRSYVYSLNPCIWWYDFPLFTPWSSGRLSDLPGFIKLFKSKQLCSTGSLTQDIPNYHRLGGFNNKHLFFPFLEAVKLSPECQHDRVLCEWHLAVSSQGRKWASLLSRITNP